MGLLPHSASFEEQVADFFVLVRGSGLMLSALDRELLTRWSEVGAPFEVVARGIRRAAEKAAYDARPGMAALRSLRACKREVESEIKKHLDRSAGRTGKVPSWPAPLEEETPPPAAPQRTVAQEREARFRKVLQELGTRRPELAAGCQRLTAQLARLLEASASGADDRVIAALVRAAPFGERRGWIREARAAAGAQPGVSLRARKLSLRVHRAAVVRRALQLPAFW